MSRYAKPSPQLMVFVLAAVAVGIGLSFGVCTQDDAFISFRYAENLATGNGLVFNVGERVEGFTNLSWTVLFAIIMALGGEPVIASVFLGWIGVAFLVILTGRFAQRQIGAAGAVVASVFVALDSQMVLEGVEGLETVAYTVCVTAGIFNALHANGLLRSSVWFAIATLTRPEAPLIWCGLHMGLWVRDRWSPESIRRSLWCAWPVLLTVVAVTLWRVFYFGDWLPNTFYAKTGGAPYARGMVYVADHMVSRPILWCAALASVMARSNRPMTTIVAVVLLYVVAVGGDFKPTGRFLIPILPVLSVMAASSICRPWASQGLGRVGLVMATLCFLWLRWGQYDSASDWAAERHANLQSRQLVGDWLAQNTPQETVLAVHSAGVVPYYSGRRTIDMWGLTNRQVARTEVEGMGTGMAGHERSAPAYVFSLRPDIYLPEDKLFTLRPWRLQPESGVTEDFAQDYRPVNVHIEGRWLNMWVRKNGLFSGLQIAEGAIEQ